MPDGTEKREMSFMLKRWLKGELWNLTPGTRDSELMYLLGVYEYLNRYGHDTLFECFHIDGGHVTRALNYLRHNLIRDNLMIGCDWRDTMHGELGDKPLLTNNCLLHHLLQLMGKWDEAQVVHNAIHKTLWDGKQFLDYPGTSRFDPLGGALAVLCYVAGLSRYPSILQGFESVDTKHGVTIKCRHNPTSDAEAAAIERTDGVFVWPFVLGFEILALIHMGELGRAHQQAEKLFALDGFFEYYDPNDGRGYGAPRQGWTALLILRVHNALKKAERTLGHSW